MLIKLDFIMNMLGYSYFLLPLLVIGLFSLIPVYAEPQELHIVEGTNLEIMIDDSYIRIGCPSFMP